MPDHRGSLFDHKKSMLVQLPIYDLDNKLIPTFHLSHRLRVGTIVMAKCSLQCYITSKDYNERKVTFDYYSYILFFNNNHQTYQLNAETIRILAESCEAQSPPPTEHNLPSDASSSTSTVSDSISKALADFPHKKQKTQGKRSNTLFK